MLIIGKMRERYQSILMCVGAVALRGRESTNGLINEKGYGKTTSNKH